MNRLSGLIMGGVVLNTEDNLNSIPGQVLQLDARERVDIVGGAVTLWGDKSPMGTNVQARGISPREKGIWIKSADNNYFKRSTTDYSFLHNGSKFGIYAINKIDWSLTTPSSGFGPLWTGAVGAQGMQLAYSTAGNGSISLNLRTSASGISRSLSNLLNPSHANYSPSGNVYIQSMLNLGQTLGVRLTYGNAVANLTPFYSNLVSYPQGPHSTFGVNQANAGSIYRGGMTLIYNWGFEYTDTQVLAFNDRIMALLAKEKVKFIQADI